MPLRCCPVSPATVGMTAEGLDAFAPSGYCRLFRGSHAFFMCHMPERLDALFFSSGCCFNGGLVPGGCALVGKELDAFAFTSCRRLDSRFVPSRRAFVGEWFNAFTLPSLSRVKRPFMQLLMAHVPEGTDTFSFARGCGLNGTGVGSMRMPMRAVGRHSSILAAAYAASLTNPRLRSYTVTNPRSRFAFAFRWIAISSL